MKENPEVKNMDNHKNTRSTPKFKLLESSEELVTNVLGIVSDNKYFPKEKTFLKARIRESTLNYDSYVRASNDYYIYDYSDQYQVKQRLDSINKATESLAVLSSAIRRTPSLISNLDPNHKELKAIARSISENKKLINGWNSNTYNRHKECIERKAYINSILASDNCPIFFIIPEKFTSKTKNEIIYGMDFSSGKNKYYNT